LRSASPGGALAQKSSGFDQSINRDPESVYSKRTNIWTLLPPLSLKVITYSPAAGPAVNLALRCAMATPEIGASISRATAQNLQRLARQLFHFPFNLGFI
jgi:hypothetical protein